MRRLLPFALLTLLFLAGCTPMQWVREGAVPATEVLETDSASCRQQAWREAQFRSWAYRPITPYVARDSFGRRSVAWPYGPFYSPYGDPFFEESRLADFCMRAKGYDLVPVDKPAGKAPG
jgi:hypothetical protein